MYICMCKRCLVCAYMHITCTLHAYVCTYVCYVHLHVKLNMFLLQVYTHIILLVCIYSSVCEEGFKTDVRTYVHLYMCVNCTCVC